MGLWGNYGSWRPGTRRITDRKPINSDKKKNTSDVDLTDPEAAGKLSPLRYVARRLYVTSFMVVNFFLSAAITTGCIFVLMNSDRNLWLLIFLFGCPVQMLLAWLAMVKNQRMQKNTGYTAFAAVLTSLLLVMCILALITPKIVVFAFSFLVLAGVLVFSWFVVISNLILRIRFLEI